MAISHQVRRLEDDKLVFQPEETFTVQFAPGLRFEPRDFAIYGGLNPSPAGCHRPSPARLGARDWAVARQISPEEQISVKKRDLLARVMPLVDAAAASGTDIAQASPRRSPSICSARVSPTSRAPSC